MNEVVSQHLATLPPPLREKVPAVSPGVEQVVMKAVAKDPKERFPTVRDFAAALEQASWVEEDATIAVQAPGSIEEPTIAAVLFSLQAAAPANPTPAPAQPGTVSRVVGTPPTLYTYSEHTSKVNAVTWSVGGWFLSSASDDQTVQVWDIVTGYNSFTSRGHASAVTAVCWSPDGKGIASASDDGNVQVWDTTTGRKVGNYRHAAPVRTVAWSPDNTRIAFGGDDSVVQVWVVP